MIIDLHHEEFGRPSSHRPLLLLHGGAGTIDSHFGGVIPTLAGDRLVVGVELQGHGHTPHADRPYTAAGNAGDTLAVLDALGLDRVDVLAFSNGCLTALQLALTAPPRIGRLVIASGFVRRDGMVDGFWEQFDDPDPTAMPPKLAATYRAVAPEPGPEALERMFLLDIELMRSAADRTDEELAALIAPTLFLSGDRDIVRPEHTLEAARLVADGRAALLPAGHGDYLGTTDGGPVDEQLTAATTALIRSFLSGRPH